jgi:predicted transcriptional regulator
MTLTPLQGDLQIEVMRTLWRLRSGTVERVRRELPPRYQGAYTTVQTVLNRLAERGLVDRRRIGKVIEYSPRLTEAEYIARSMERALAGASVDARQAALADLISGLQPAELDVVRRHSKDIARKRRKA